MTYQDRIRGILARRECDDPRHVEAHMRVDVGGTLDGLSHEQFVAAVWAAVDAAGAMSREDNERLAASYGIQKPARREPCPTCLGSGYRMLTNHPDTHDTRADYELVRYPHMTGCGACGGSGVRS